VSEGINVPVSTWEFPLFWKVIFQREASFGSLFVTVYGSESGSQTLVKTAKICVLKKKIFL
jgi:hypothetical protein